MAEVATGKSTPIVLEEVIIRSPLNPIPFNIANVVTELEVFEHIDKPYTTAVLSFVDGDRVMSSLNVSGAETVDVKIKANTKVAETVTMQFYIDRVITTAKGNETNELIVVHMTEAVNYHSNLRNVNKAYSGKPTTIMANIAAEFLSKPLKSSKELPQKTKIIVPNLTPLNAMSWIKNRLATEKGYPFYMFSYLGGEELYLVDLKTMLEQKAINEGKPYQFTESAIPSPDENFDETKRRRVILGYEVKNTENLYTLIDKGMVGATHQFIDVTNNTHFNHKHNLGKVVDTLVGDNLLKSRPLYTTEYKHGGESYNDIESRHVSQIMSSQSYDDFDSYNESPSNGEYKLNSTQRAIDSLIKKQPLSIKVNGIDFLQLEGNSTIGNKLEVKFPANLNDEGASESRFDTKKSGEYLIYSAKHSFQRDNYVVSLTCVKLSNGEV